MIMGLLKRGMKLTATTLATVIKYTASSDQLNKQQLLSKKLAIFTRKNKCLTPLNLRQEHKISDTH